MPPVRLSGTHTRHVYDSHTAGNERFQPTLGVSDPAVLEVAWSEGTGVVSLPAPITIPLDLDVPPEAAGQRIFAHVSGQESCTVLFSDFSTTFEWKGRLYARFRAPAPSRSFAPWLQVITEDGHFKGAVGTEGLLSEGAVAHIALEASGAIVAAPQWSRDHGAPQAGFVLYPGAVAREARLAGQAGPATGMCRTSGFMEVPFRFLTPGTYTLFIDSADHDDLRQVVQVLPLTDVRVAPLPARKMGNRTVLEGIVTSETGTFAEALFVSAYDLEATSSGRGQQVPVEWKSEGGSTVGRFRIDNLFLHRHMLVFEGTDGLHYSRVDWLLPGSSVEVAAGEQATVHLGACRE